ncbi:MAG: PAN/Apple domain-containing protein [Burkholderiales bacterium]
MRVIRWMWAALLVGLSCGPGVAQYGAPGGVVRYDATDFPGNDIDGMTGPARSFEDCAQRCMADGRCGAFTFNLNNGNCIPKSSAGDQQRNDRAISGVVDRAGSGYGGGNMRGVTRYDQTDLPGNDIEGTAGRARSFEDCAQRCLSDDRCGAFTFNLNNRNCIPKSSAGAQERNGRAVSGVLNRRGGGGGRPGAGMPIERHDQTDFPGNDIEGMAGRARSFDDCAQRCLSDGRCGAFTFNLNDGNCIPKSSAGNAERNGRAVSGVVNRGGAGYPGGGPNACSATGAGSCPGCSVSCLPSQRPMCTAAVEGFGGPCAREASCRCMP